jgi:hypothetical protein
MSQSNEVINEVIAACHELFIEYGDITRAKVTLVQIDQCQDVNKSALLRAIYIEDRLETIKLELDFIRSIDDDKRQYNYFVNNFQIHLKLVDFCIFSAYFYGMKLDEKITNQEMQKTFAAYKAALKHCSYSEEAVRSFYTKFWQDGLTQIVLKSIPIINIFKEEVRKISIRRSEYLKDENALLSKRLDGILDESLRQGRITLYWGTVVMLGFFILIPFFESYILFFVLFFSPFIFLVAFIGYGYLLSTITWMMNKLKNKQ